MLCVSALSAAAVRALGLTPHLRVDAAGHLVDVLVQLGEPQKDACEIPTTPKSQGRGASHAVQLALLCHADAQLQGAPTKPGSVPSPLGHSVLKHRHLKRQGKCWAPSGLQSAAASCSQLPSAAASCSAVGSLWHHRFFSSVIGLCSARVVPLSWLSLVELSKPEAGAVYIYIQREPERQR